MLTGLHVNIIGPQYLQNTLLASFLEEQTHVHCHVHDANKDIPKSLKHDTTPALTLIDSNKENDKYSPLETYAYCRGQLGSQDLFAFINTPPGGEIEALAATLDVHGLFYEDASQENLSKGVKAIFDGELWLPRKIISEQLQHHKSSGKLLIAQARDHKLLTAREIEILNLIATGAKNTDIANNLCLSVHTIKTHIYHIYKKIDVSNRMQAVNWASNNLQ
jgi:LuxR family transcriptional regulator of csgAB operon